MLRASRVPTARGAQPAAPPTSTRARQGTTAQPAPRMNWSIRALQARTCLPLARGGWPSVCAARMATGARWPARRRWRAQRARTTRTTAPQASISAHRVSPAMRARCLVWCWVTSCRAPLATTARPVPCLRRSLRAPTARTPTPRRSLVLRSAPPVPLAPLARWALAALRTRRSRAQLGTTARQARGTALSSTACPARTRPRRT